VLRKGTSLWLPEQYSTAVRATAFAFATSFGRFVGAGVNFLLGSMACNTGTLGKPVVAIAFAIGLLIIPFCYETKGAAATHSRKPQSIAVR